MERPTLPPLVPGRSALVALLQVERTLQDALRLEEAEALRRREDVEDEALRIKTEGEERLKQIVLDAERRAVQEVEARATDRVSQARIQVQRWIDQAEQEGEDLVRRAVLRLVTDDEGEAR